MNNFTNSFCLNEEFELSGFEDFGKNERKQTPEHRKEDIEENV